MHVRASRYPAGCCEALYLAIRAIRILEACWARQVDEANGDVQKLDGASKRADASVNRRFEQVNSERFDSVTSQN